MHCNFIKKYDFSDLRQEILTNWSDTYISTNRKKIKSQAAADAIFLRYTPNIIKPNVHMAFASTHSHYVIDSGLEKYFTKTYNLVVELAKEFNGLLGRVMLAKLKPNTSVLPHIDIGGYYECRNRYHLVIQSNSSTMLVENKNYTWFEDEIWELNNKLMHGATNSTLIDRIHVIFDVLPFNKVEFMLSLIEKYNLIDYGVNPAKNMEINF